MALDNKSIVYVIGQAVAFIGVLVVVWLFYPEEKRGSMIAIIAVIGVVALAGGYFVNKKLRPRSKEK